MAAIAPIAIKDGASTPVTHTYVPNSISTDGKARFVERVGNIPAGFPTIEYRVTEPSGSGNVYRVNGTLNVPVTAVVNGVSTVDHFNKVNFEFFLSSKSTDTERGDLVALFASLMGNTQIVSAVKSLEHPW